MGNVNKPQLVLHCGPFYYKGSGSSMTVQAISGDAAPSSHSYLYLYDSSDMSSFISCVHVPPYSRTKTATFEDAVLLEDRAYVVVWSTCSCAHKNLIATSAPVEVFDVNSYTRKLKEEAEDAERTRRAEQKRKHDEESAERSREIAEADRGRYYFLLSKDERAVLKRHFISIDSDGNGTITRNELKSYYKRQLGEELFDSEVDDMLNEGASGFWRACIFLRPFLFFLILTAPSSLLPPSLLPPQPTLSSATAACSSPSASTFAAWRAASRRASSGKICTNSSPATLRVSDRCLPAAHAIFLLILHLNAYPSYSPSHPLLALSHSH